MKKAVLFGAGNIGRGFIGQLLCEAGYEVVFVDVDETLVNALNANGTYELQTVLGDEVKNYVVGPVKALHAAKDKLRVAEAVASADLAATAVGANALKFLVPNLVAGLELRAKRGDVPLDILLCENLHGAAGIFREMVEKSVPENLKGWFGQNIGFVNTVIGRMVPAPTPEMRAANVSFIRTEPYCELPVDKDAFKGAVPEIKGLLPRSPFEIFTARKLYLHNCGHAMLAYLGFVRDYEQSVDALKDPIILHTLKGALEESVNGISGRFGKENKGWLESHVEELLTRFANVPLGDTILRLGRDPFRKLQPEDRLVGAARLAEAAGVKPLNLAMGIAAAFRFPSQDDALQRSIEEKGFAATLQEVCKISQRESLGKLVCEAYSRLRLKKAVVAGHICLDIIPAIDHSVDLLPGRLLEVGAAKLATGGAVSNTGVAMHILGQPVSLVGKIGADAFGEAVEKVLESYGKGLGKGLCVARDSTTSYSVVVSVPGRDRIFLHCPGANHQFDAESIDERNLADASLLHFGYPPIMERMYADGGATLERVFSKAKAAGLTSSMDMVTPDPAGPSGQVDWLAIFKRVLPLVDVFLPSADELLYVLDRPRFGHGDELSPKEIEALADRLIEFGVAIAGIKLGGRGLYIKTAPKERLARAGKAMPDDVSEWSSRELWFPTFKVSRFVGATGAGDVTIGAFLCALLRGEPLEKAGRFACAVGACNVEAPDALSGLLDWAATWHRLGAHWETNPVKVEEPDWRLDQTTGIWHGPREKFA